MDTDELDHWLDADDGPDSPAWPSSPSPPAPTDTARRRPRWMWVGASGLAVWLAVMAVVAVGGRGPVDGADDDGADVLGHESSTPTDLPGLGDDLQLGASELVGIEGPDAPEDDLAPSSPEGAHDGSQNGATQPDAPVDPGGLQAVHGAAVAALRATLTGSSEGRDSYLEHATPVGAERLGDVAIVVVDATWLEGAAGALDAVHQGRWAVPMAVDGTVLGNPWQVPPGPGPLTEPQAPPVGTMRLPEIQAAMHDAGWDDVSVAAADAHPLLPDVVVAVVDGAPPSGSPRTGHVVWLRDAGDGLRLLGTGAAGSPSPGSGS